MAEIAAPSSPRRGLKVASAFFAYVSIGVVLGIGLRDPSLALTLLATPFTWVVVSFTALCTLTYVVGCRLGVDAEV